MRTRRFLAIVSLSAIFSCQSKENLPLTLNPLFTDHMVLQQNDEVAVWGRYTAGENITLEGSWGSTSTTSSDENGNWMARISTSGAGGPFELKIATSDSTYMISNVMLGEVWLASGQSNMEMTMAGYTNEPIDNWEEEVANADFPDLRIFHVQRALSAVPETSIVGKWRETNPENAIRFSATGYFYGRELYKSLNVPIGIITSSWGGTPSESWTSHSKLTELNEFTEEIKSLDPEKIAAYEEWYSKFESIPLPEFSEEGWMNLDLGDSELSTSDFDDSDWKSVNLPGAFEEMESLSSDGVFWFRKTINIDNPEQDYVLNITEGVDDMDHVYVNGALVGFTLCWNCPREYEIPEGTLKSGNNLIAIRAADTGGIGAVKGDINLTGSNGSVIDISGEWKFSNTASKRPRSLVLFNSNSEAMANPPEGVESFRINAHTPGGLFNAMINPLVPYTIKGAIWYQGESNVSRAEQYERIFPAMIEDWREQWAREFSFYFVQIAPFGYGNDLSPALRDAQRKSLNTPKTGMAVTMDIGLERNIHPGNKQDVGNRLARLALRNDYGRNVVASGPIFSGIEITDNLVTISFDHAGDGLVLREADYSQFELAGEDGEFHSAGAIVNGDQLVLQSANVPEPVHARYGWKDFIVGTLFNSEGLPASSFSTE